MPWPLALFVGVAAIAAIHWLFVNVIIPVFINVVMPGILIFLIVVFSYSLFIACRDLFLSFIFVRDERRRSGPQYLHAEAEIAYLFGPVRDDIGLFFRDSVRRAIERISAALSAAQDADTWYEAIFPWTNWAFALTFGLPTSVLVIATAAFASAIAAAALVVVFTFLYFVDVTYMWMRGIFARCPESSCNHKSFHLHYDCPRCSGRPQRHRHLRVNRAGALYHKCRCGNTIPAHILTGRGVGMKAYCEPNGHPINEELIGTEVTHVALVGGPDSGKTTLLVGILRRLLSHKGYQRMRFRLEDRVQDLAVRSWIMNLERGHLPPKTAARSHRATTVLFEDLKGTKRSLYFFDPSGEMFSNSKLKTSHSYFDRSDYVIFALDPLSLPNFQAKAVAKLDRASVLKNSPCEERPIATASSLVSLMDNNGAKRRDGRFSSPLNLVLTKSDVLDISKDLTTDSQIRKWIGSNGSGDVVRLIEANFQQVKMTHVNSSQSQSTSTQNDSLDSLLADILAHAIKPVNRPL